jgi:hypothetical protein
LTYFNEHAICFTETFTTEAVTTEAATTEAVTTEAVTTEEVTTPEVFTTSDAPVETTTEVYTTPVPSEGNVQVSAPGEEGGLSVWAITAIIATVGGSIWLLTKAAKSDFFNDLASKLNGNNGRYANHEDEAERMSFGTSEMQERRRIPAFSV